MNWNRREFLRHVALAGSAGLGHMRPVRAGAEPGPPSSVPLKGRRRLASAIEVRHGVPQIVVNGKVEAPLLFFHGRVSGVAPLTADVGPEWREYEFSFSAPVTDDNVAAHVRNARGQEAWGVDHAGVLAVQGGSRACPSLLCAPAC